MNPVLARQTMVDQQIVARGIRDPLVLAAMRAVPREKFVLPQTRELAYQDVPLPIAANQTISQPFVVAWMIQAVSLLGGERVLEIGTGSGYAAAVLAEIAGQVWSVERIGKLARRASFLLKKLHFDNVQVVHADGTLGWPEQAPYDAILVTAGGPCIPESLKAQLKVGGRMVIPVGAELDEQKLARIKRLSPTEFQTQEIGDVRFVPLIGDEGWSHSGR